METKQVIIIRKDLNMRKGKCVAQGSHASMACILNLMKGHSQRITYDMDEFSRQDGYTLKNKTLFFKEGSALDNWINGIFTKICVSVNSEEELENLYNKAKELGLPCSIITDSGLTEFNGVPTKTAVAIGPAESNEINQITGHLPLL